MIAPADRLLRTVEAIYEAAHDPLQWPHVLAEVAGCFGDVGAILIWQKDDGSFGTIVSESLRDVQRDYIEQGWSRRDIKAIRAQEKGYFFNGEPFADRHICSEDEICGDPFYTKFMAGHGLGWIGSVAVSPAANLGVALSVQRMRRRNRNSPLPNLTCSRCSADISSARCGSRSDCWMLSSPASGSARL